MKTHGLLLPECTQTMRRSHEQLLLYRLYVESCLTTYEAQQRLRASNNLINDEPVKDGRQRGMHLRSSSQVSRELEEFDLERFRRVGAHLDLMWNVAKVCVVATRLQSGCLTDHRP